MTLWFAIVLGLIQGITEFLPVSSTAHLRIAPTLLGQTDPGAAFDAVIQLGTLAAVIVYYRARLWRMARGVLVDRQGEDARLAWYVVAGTVPIGAAGLLLKKHVEGDLRSLWVVTGALVVVAVVMVVGEQLAKHRRALADIGVRDAIIVGCAQACALVPGVSRSGSTMTAALLIGLARPAAAELSFLLSIPAVGAAGVFELRHAVHDLHGSPLAPLVASTLVAAVTGYAAIAWLMRYLRQHSFVGFAAYRVLLGGVLIALLVAGTISPLTGGH
jgi:undecaprenyl-diphosphatase